MKTKKSDRKLLRRGKVSNCYVNIFNLSIVLLSLILIQCSGGGGGSNDTGSNNALTITSFPGDMAITSPTETISSNSSAALAGLISTYDVETTEIDAILSASSLSDCFGTFFGDLTATETNAECYGPEVDYENHPDGTGGSDPLPPGDLGIWLETEGSTTEACTAAQLNARMEALKNKTTTALKTLASIICTINNTSTLSMPSAGSSLSMTSEMNTMIATAVSGIAPTVNSATLSAAANDVGTTDYTYSINITYNMVDPADNITLQTDMTHRPLDSTNSTYKGLFSYYFDNEDNQGNCNRDFGSLNTSDITELGSVAYEKSSSSSLVFDMRYTQACGSGNTSPLVSNELDPSVKSTTTIGGGGATPDFNGWASNFTIMAADFNPSDNTGNYAFSWQAGVDDGTARTFNVHLEDSDSDGLLDGSAFFGYGDDIESSDGTILGIYCNWAGPDGGVGNITSKRQSLAQKQTIEENTVSGVFEAVSSNITYAPTLNCDYDGLGSFSYDSDADGTVDTVASTPVTNNLVDPSDASDGVTASGYTTPTVPSGL